MTDNLSLIEKLEALKTQIIYVNRAVSVPMPPNQIELVDKIIAIVRQHYEGRPAVEGKPLELMTRDELLAYIKQKETRYLLSKVERVQQAIEGIWDQCGASSWQVAMAAIDAMGDASTGNDEVHKANASVRTSSPSSDSPSGYSDASFESAIASLGDCDDEFSKWHLDEGELRSFVAKCRPKVIQREMRYNSEEDAGGMPPTYVPVRDIKPVNIDCRAAFEKWMRSTGETPSAFMQSNGCYVDAGVQAQWMAYRADRQPKPLLPYKHYTWEDIAMLVQENRILKNRPTVPVSGKLSDEDLLRAIRGSGKTEEQRRPWVQDIPGEYGRIEPTPELRKLAERILSLAGVKYVD